MGDDKKKDFYDREYWNVFFKNKGGVIGVAVSIPKRLSNEKENIMITPIDKE